jgi:transcriptional regulator with XRE-family HTH domain
MAVRKEQAPHPIDVHVGANLRLRRLQLKMSQSALAAKLGISFQAVQKYEIGTVRLSASRLYDVAKALETDPCFGFAGFAGLSEDAASYAAEGFDRREADQLLRSYYGIRDRRLQDDVRRLLATLGDGAEE